MLLNQYRNQSREYQGRGHHLASGKLMKYFFVHGTEWNIFHDFAKRVMTQTTATGVCLRMIITSGVKTQMHQVRLGVGMALIIGHMWI